MSPIRIAIATSLLGLMAAPVLAHTDCEGVYQLHLKQDEVCPEAAVVGGAGTGAGAAGVAGAGTGATTTLLGGLTAGTAVAGAVTLAVVIAAVGNDGNGPIGTTVTSTTGVASK